MKPTLAALLLLTLSQTLTFAQEARRFIEEERLLGPVHTVEVQFAEIYSPNDREDQVKRRRHQKIIYDRRGKEIERINFKENGSIENRNVQLLDASGRIIGYEGYETTADGKSERLTGKSSWTYDEHGNRIGARSEGERTDLPATTWRYNAKGQVVEETRVTDNGAWKQTKTNTYDENGYLSKTIFNTNGSIEVIEQTHDSAGHLLSYKYSSANPQSWQEAKYLYDAFGREIERSGEDAITQWKFTTSYDAKGRISKRVTSFDYKKPNIISTHAPEPGIDTFRYNENNQVIEEATFLPGGALIRKTISEYDDTGKLRNVRTISNGVVISNVSFEYDKWGNCIKRWMPDTDAFGKPYIYVLYRVITYYDEK